jgi:hypothetical protein
MKKSMIINDPETIRELQALYRLLKNWSAANEPSISWGAPIWGNTSSCASLVASARFSAACLSAV